MTVPGEILVGEGPIELFDEAAVRHVEVVNTGDRPIQIGSHYHFAEANPSLSFDREAAFGCRLAIPAGTSVRFEPGIERQVGLVRLGGRRVVPGLRGLVGGPLDGDGPVGGGPLGGAVGGGAVDGGVVGGGVVGGAVGGGPVGGAVDGGAVDGGVVGEPVGGGGAGGGSSAGAGDEGGPA